MGEEECDEEQTHQNDGCDGCEVSHGSLTSAMMKRMTMVTRVMVKNGSQARMDVDWLYCMVTPWWLIRLMGAAPA